MNKDKAIPNASEEAAQPMNARERARKRPKREAPNSKTAAPVRAAVTTENGHVGSTSSFLHPTLETAGGASGNLPAELRGLRQWVTWALVKNEKGASTKIPYTPGSNSYASTTNPKTWGTNAEALVDVSKRKRSGIGFVFTQSDPYIGIDLDHCFENGKPRVWALDIVRALDSYTEISQSGEGLHIILKGQLPAGARKRKDKGVNIECYESGRYFAMTGNVLTSAPAEVHHRQAQVNVFHKTYMSNMPTPSNGAKPANSNKSKYVAAALAGEVARLGRAQPGERNDELNRAAFVLGQLVGADQLAMNDVERELTTAALAVGLDENEIAMSLRSGLTAGIAKPRVIPDRPNGNGHHPATQVEGESTPPPRYVVKGGAFHSVEQARDGGTYTKALCNFTARIVEEETLDNGQDKATRFVIKGQLQSGAPLPICEVNSTAFGSMNWVMEHWGVRAIVKAGQSTRDKLREAVQESSQECSSKRVFTHTGWRMIDGQRVYLHNGGALGMAGVSVQLNGRLSQYTLPNTLEGVNLSVAMQASLRVLGAAQLVVSFPLWGAMFLSPLAEFTEPDFTGFVYGQSGGLKSSYVAKLLCHYGNFTAKTLPENWESSHNILLKHAFVIKDAPLVIDDYAPQASGVDAAKLETKAHLVLRAAGNRSARNRMNADTSDRPGYPPRGLLLVTGEHLPSTESIAARLLPLEFLVDEKKQPVTVDQKKLKKVQNESDELLQQAMAGYILWVGEQWDILRQALPKRLENLRDDLAGEGHLRTPATFAQVLLGIQLGLQYAQHVNAITAEKAKELQDQAMGIIRILAQKQARFVKSERPSVLFLDTLNELFAQGKAYVVPTDMGLDKDRHGDFLGWYDADYAYLLSEATHRFVAKHCREGGIPFHISRAALTKLLESEKVLIPGTEDDRRTTVFQNQRTLKLKRQSLPGLTGVYL